MELLDCGRILREGFGRSEQVISLHPMTDGRIHETFLLRTEERSYILQRLNREALVSQEAVMQNLRLVCGELRRGSYSLTVPTFLWNETDGLYRCKDGSFVRISEYIPNADTKEIPAEKLSYEAGWAYGHFLQALENVPVGCMKVPFEGFHDTRGRVKHLSECMAACAFLTKEDASLVKELLGLSEQAYTVQRLGEKGLLPVRTTHNDTKLSNVLFSPTGKALAVIDFDTVMPGLMAYDYGDAIRSLMSRFSDSGVLRFRLAPMRAFTEGYLKATDAVRTEQETASLADGILSVTFELAVRYWMDYFEGERYFKTEYKGQCRDRAIAYTGLAKDFYDNTDIIRESIEELRMLAGKEQDV